MGKLRNFSGKELCSLLEKYRFFVVRQKGSHIIVQKKTSTSTITIPIPDHREIKIGTLHSIIRQSQLNRNIFEA
ncbi:MAG: type II toxin-antitoxin system HicA family toxin [Methanomicrobiales archaeon]|nr:type II toxin-antitoxin system HicA family toxin [Methanomicrobiales archaeon]